ncbi:MAG TPA: DUF6569 family protein [Blastocatellia bacterium]|nr:DUF6569 family protein [Blastocatellia bacterium]
MKAPTMFVAGVLLSGLALACSWSSRVLEASPLNAQASRSIIKAASSPVRTDWRVGAPIAFEKLTIFPVISDQPVSSTEFITLDQGLLSGKVIITELGANGRSRRINRRQLSETPEVNRLALTNKSGKSLVLIAGEMLLGGQQDRIVGHDCIIEASNTPVPFDVFCVEHGRWSGEGAFGQQGGAAVASGAGSGSGSGSRAGLADSDRRTGVVAPMALPKIREKAQAQKSQGDVWTAVAETVTVNRAVSSTGDLKSVYQNKRVNSRLDDYDRAFKSKLSAASVVGVIAAVGGKIVSADVFASHALFQAYWPKMLKSYALESVSTIDASKQQVNRIDAEAFLARSQGTGDSEGKAGVYRLAENQSGSDASFELQYTKTGSTLVHFNRVTKR